MIGLSEVYAVSRLTGNFVEPKEFSAEMSPTIPKCPHCSQQIRQHITQRYNRLINKAVIDEMTKRFIVSGQEKLRQSELTLEGIRVTLEATLPDLVASLSRGIMIAPERRVLSHDTKKTLQTRYRAISLHRASVVRLSLRLNESHQPALKLQQAMKVTLHSKDSLEESFSKLSVTADLDTSQFDHRITLGLQRLLSEVDCAILEDKFAILAAMAKEFPGGDTALVFPNGSYLSETQKALDSCAELIAISKDRALPKIAVQASIYHARMVNGFRARFARGQADQKRTKEFVSDAILYLKDAEKLCDHTFRDADSLRKAVEHMLHLLGKERYEEVTKEELEAIKRAMVTGSQAMATNSGHWYNCENGHPVSHLQEIYPESCC